MKKFILDIKPGRFVFLDVDALKDKIKRLLDENITLMETSIEEIDETPEPEIVDLKEDTKKSIGKVLRKSYTKRTYTKKDIRKGKKWTPEIFDFVRENLDLSNDELTKEINKKFGINTTTKSLGVQMAFNKINRKGLRREKKERNKSNLKKNFPRKITPEISNFIESRVGKVGDYRIAADIEEKFGIEISHATVKDHRKKNGWPGIGKGRKLGEKYPQIYTKEVIDFMKDCVDKEMNIREAHDATQKQFEKPFVLTTFRTVAVENKIRFRLTKEKIKRYDPEIEKIIKDNQHLSSEGIRDEIIDKTGEYIKTSEINVFLQRTKKEEKGMTPAEIKKTIKDIGADYDEDEEEDFKPLPPEDDY